MVEMSEDDYEQIVNDDEVYQDFFSDNIDTMLDIYDDFIERFSFSPFFLGTLGSVPLVEFLIACLLDEPQINRSFQQPFHNRKDFEMFLAGYDRELRDSYNTASHFVRCHGGFLSPSTWNVFCFRHSDLSEVKNGDFRSLVLDEVSL